METGWKHEAVDLRHTDSGGSCGGLDFSKGGAVAVKKTSLGILVVCVYLLISQLVWFNKEMAKPYTSVVASYIGTERPPSYQEWLISQYETRGRHGAMMTMFTIGAAVGATGLLFSWRDPD